MNRPPTAALASSARTRRFDSRLAAGSWRALGVVCLVLLSVALGRDVVALGGDEPRLGAAFLAVTAASACAVFIAVGPVLCLAAIGGLAAAGWLPVLGQFGGVDVTLADVFYAGAVVGWASGALKDSASATSPTRARSPIPQLPAILFLAFAGLTLWHVQAVDPGELKDSLISWLRLVQTASLAWLAAAVIETKGDLMVVLGSIAAGGSVAVLLALEQAITEGGNPLVDRYAETLGANALGLISGLLLVLAVCGTPSPRWNHRLALGLTGLVGLALAKSVAALVATGLALAVGASFAGPRTPLERATRVVVALMIASVVVFGVVQFLRPSSTPTHGGFRESSASQRIIVGAAGLEVFERNPVIGAGWRRSDSPAVIGDPEIASELRSRFSEARQDFFPDVNPASVHNTYVQMLADLGLIGFGLFVAAIASLGLGIQRVLGRARGSELSPLAWSSALGLVVILLWLNDNPLYGGQVETIVLALLVGALAAVGRRVGAAAPRAETLGERRRITPESIPRHSRRGFPGASSQGRTRGTTRGNRA
jgi:O-antigen ligase